MLLTIVRSFLVFNLLDKLHTGELDTVNAVVLIIGIVLCSFFQSFFLRPSIANDTESAIKLANMFGVTGNQAYLSADRLITKKHNFSPIKELGITLIAPSVEPLLTPSEIGQEIGLTGQAVNKRLVELQMQEKIGGKWVPKLKGVDYAVMIDLEANGTRQQLKWKVGVKELLKQLK